MRQIGATYLNGFGNNRFFSKMAGMRWCTLEYFQHGILQKQKHSH
jgi:hypothetical protein